MLGLIVMAATLHIVGCSTTEPSIPDASIAEVSFDGLVKVENSRMANAWVKRDLDLSGYTKILPVRADIHYRSVRNVSRSAARSAGATDFPLDDNQKQRIDTALEDVFRSEMANSKYYTLTDKPGSDTLLVTGTLLDVVSNVPPEPIGRSDMYLTKLGEATFAVELRDSQSGEILARAVDRRSASPAVAQRSNPVTNASEFKRVARQWATMLRTALDSFHDL
jgi:hypothetical protein